MSSLRTLAERISEASRNAEEPVIRAADVAQLRKHPEGSLEHLAAAARVLRRLHDAGVVGVLGACSRRPMRARRSPASPL